MAISIELPPELEASLRKDVENLEHAAKEALLVELYRQGKLTESQLGRALGLSRLEVDGLLKMHGVFLDISAQEVADESRGLRQLRNPRDGQGNAGRR
jgi:hypothetical protein